MMIYDTILNLKPHGSMIMAPGYNEVNEISMITGDMIGFVLLGVIILSVIIAVLSLLFIRKDDKLDGDGVGPFNPYQFDDSVNNDVDNGYDDALNGFGSHGRIR